MRTCFGRKQEIEIGVGKKSVVDNIRVVEGEDVEVLKGGLRLRDVEEGRKIGRWHYGFGFGGFSSGQGVLREGPEILMVMQ